MLLRYDLVVTTPQAVHSKVDRACFFSRVVVLVLTVIMLMIMIMIINITIVILRIT